MRYHPNRNRNKKKKPKKNEIIKQGQRLQLPNDRTTFDGDWKRSCTVEMGKFVFFFYSFLFEAEDVGQLFESAFVPTGAVVVNRTILAPHLYDDKTKQTDKKKQSRYLIDGKASWTTSACDGLVGATL